MKEKIYLIIATNTLNWGVTSTMVSIKEILTTLVKNQDKTITKQKDNCRNSVEPLNIKD